MDKKAGHIAVAGNIGSGKTTLTKLLSEHFGWEAQYESVDDNPYLNDFYADMLRWSFNLQVYFLNSRFRQVLNIRKSGQEVIQDRTIYEDAYIFAPNLHDMGLMASRDFENYSKLFDLMSKLVEPPDLIIYLRSDVPSLVRQIEKRRRGYEKQIRIDYLTRLNERYESWIKSYDSGKVLIMDVSEKDFKKNPKHLSEIIDRVNAELHGIF